MLSQPWIDSGGTDKQAGWIKSRWWWRCRVIGALWIGVLAGLDPEGPVAGEVEESPVSFPIR